MNKNYFKAFIKSVIKETIENMNESLSRGESWINEGIFHEHKEWIVYEGENKIVTVFEDNSRLSFEVGYPKETWGENRQKWRHKAASKWKSIAREMYNTAGLNEVGNPIVIPWKKCYHEALTNPEMKEFIRKDAQPIFESKKL